MATLPCRAHGLKYSPGACRRDGGWGHYGGRDKGQTSAVQLFRVKRDTVGERNDF